MIPVNQFILGSSDPLLYPSEKMTNSIDEQIAFLQSQKQAINVILKVYLMKKWKLLIILIILILIYLLLVAVIESAITFWFKDVDFDGDKVWEYFHMNN